MAPKKIEVTGLTATVYHPTTRHDSTPNQLADGTRIDPWKPLSHQPCRIPVTAPERIIALSRDLLSRWGGPFRYGDVVAVTGAGPLDGEWTVRDCLNARFTKRVDFLVAPYYLNRFEGVTVRLVGRAK